MENKEKNKPLNEMSYALKNNYEYIHKISL